MNSPRNYKNLDMKHTFLLALLFLLLSGCENQKTDTLTDPLGDESRFSPEQTDFRICWSRYPGWEPWGLAQSSGILERWAQHYGISVEMVYVDDYGESIDAYGRGEYDGCTMTNIEALDVASEVPTTIVVIGDYSAGNDGILLPEGVPLDQIARLPVDLVEHSVSHFVLFRAAQINGIPPQSLRTVDISENDIVPRLANGSSQAAVTWNPHLNEALSNSNLALAFSTAEIPGEVLDLMVVRSDTPDVLGYVLAGAWYEITAAISSRSVSERQQTISALARQAGVEVAAFELQLETTAMFYAAWDAVGFARSPQVMSIMSRALEFREFINPDLEPIRIVFPGQIQVDDGRNPNLIIEDAYMRAVSLDAMPSGSPVR